MPHHKLSKVCENGWLQGQQGQLCSLLCSLLYLPTGYFPIALHRPFSLNLSMPWFCEWRAEA